MSSKGLSSDACGDTAGNVEQVINNDKTYKISSKKSKKLGLPPHWYLKQSRSKNGRIYYANSILMKVTWEFPSFTPCPQYCNKCLKYQKDIWNSQKNRVPSTDSTLISKTELVKSEINDNLNKNSFSNERTVSDQSLIFISKRKPYKVTKFKTFVNTITPLTDSANNFQNTNDEKPVNVLDKNYILSQETSEVPSNIKSYNKIPKTDVNCKNMPTKKSDKISTKLDSVSPASANPADPQKIATRLKFKQKQNSSASSRWDQKPCEQLKQSTMPKDSQNATMITSRNVKKYPADDQVKKYTTYPVKSMKRKSSPCTEDAVDSVCKKKPKQMVGPLTADDHCVKPDHLNKTSDKKKTKKSKKAYRSQNYGSHHSESSKILDRGVNIVKINSSSEMSETSISFDEKDREKHDSTVSSTIITINDAVEPMEVDVVVAELRNIRKNYDYNQPIDTSLNMQSDCSILKNAKNELYIIVDTNVLIQNLRLLKLLSNNSSYLGKGIVIFVPYTALLELDGLKQNKTVMKDARAAIRWCNDCFTREVEQGSDGSIMVIGQSYSNYKEIQDYDTTSLSKNGDDHIRDCCLFLQKQGLHTMLISNDINLRNKALMSNVTAVSTDYFAKDVIQKDVTPLPEKINNSVLKENRHLSRDKCSECLCYTENCSCLFKKTNMDKVEVMKHSSEKSRKHNLSGAFSASACYSADSCEDDPMDGIKDSAECQLTPYSGLMVSHCDTDGVINTSNYRLLKEDNVFSESEHIKNASHSQNSQLESLCKTLGNILKFVMEKEFGDLWINIVLHKPPWTLRNVMACWHKHWLAVFMDKFSASFQRQLKEVECISVRKDIHININLLEVHITKLYAHFKKPPYEELIEYPARISSTLSNSGSNLDEKKKNISSLMCLDQNENKVLLSDNVDATPQRNVSPATSSNSNIAKDAIISTGIRMKEFVMDGVQHLADHLPERGPDCHNLLKSLSALRCCVVELALAILRWLNDGNTTTSVEELRHALLSFWLNAKEGEMQQQFLTSRRGAVALIALLTGTAETGFMTCCLHDLRSMKAELSRELAAWHVSDDVRL